MSTVVTKTAVEILTVEPASQWASQSLRALRQAAPQDIAVCSTTSYQGGSDWLMLWGPGEPMRAEAMRRQVAAGGHAVALDLAYWSRQRKVRISIDAPHPQAWVMTRAWPRARFDVDPPLMGNVWKSTGPIVVAGLGRKAKIQYGPDFIESWEAGMMEACRVRWPQRKLNYRPKPITPGGPPIDADLRGASLVITYHSNVAVDAIRLGIPAVCRDGAAAAVCASELSDDLRPLPEDVRMTFLRNLSFFQWDLSSEAAECWTFLREVLA